MVRVYLSNGTTAEIRNATQVESAHVLRPTDGGWESPGLLCKDAEGETIAEFKLSEISGYVIEGPARPIDTDVFGQPLE